MAYQYSLMDDDEDDLYAPLLDQAGDYAKTLSVRAGAQPMRGDPSAGAQVDSPWQPRASTRDPALDAQWQAAEQQALAQHSAYNPGQYGLGEAIRDNSGLAVASIVGLLAGKTRNADGSTRSALMEALPSLVQQQAGINQQSEARRAAEAQAAGDFALKARAQKDTSLANQLAVRRLQLQEAGQLQNAQRIDQAGQGLALRQDTHARTYDPNDPRQRAAAEYAIANGADPSIAGLDSRAMSQVQHATNLDQDAANTPRLAANQATIAGAKQGAENAANIRDNPALGLSRGQGAALAEEVTRPGEVQTSRETAEAGARGRETVEQPIRQQRESEAFQKSFAKDNQALLQSAQELGTVLQSANGGAIEGQGGWSRGLQAVGLGGLDTPEAQANNQRIQAALISIRHNNTGTAFSTREAADNALSILGSPTASAEDRTAAIQRTFELLQADLSAAGAARPEDAANVIQARGMSSLPSLGTAPMPKKPAQRAPAGPAAPGDNDPWAKYRVR